jgi:hypothetical protein
LLELILPKITDKLKLRQWRQEKGVKGENELPSLPPLLLVPLRGTRITSLPPSSRLLAGFRRAGSPGYFWFAGKIFAKGKRKGELFIVFLAPPTRARKTFFLPKNWLGQFPPFWPSFSWKIQISGW